MRRSGTRTRCGSRSRPCQGRILVAGAIAAHPIGGGGNSWAFLQYILGFQRLGFEVLYLEEIAPERCVDAAWKPAPLTNSHNARYLETVAARFRFMDQFALWSTNAPDERVGLPREEVLAFARSADAVVNLSGRLHDAEILGAVRKRIYVDLDPGFTQIWQAQYGVDMNLGGHDAHFTVGLCVGRHTCRVPTCNVTWQPTLPPVVLPEWRANCPPGVRYTTVADWRGYSPVQWQGRWYGQKSEEFLRIVDLPRRVSVPLELCLAIHPREPDLVTLQRNGWRIVDPRVHAASPDAYRDYVQRSRGEFTVVKNGYRVGHTGWFSDRTACYLASARPAVVQDTGFSQVLPTGHGLLAFTSVEEAAACLHEVEGAYSVHSQAAYAWAEAHCSSDHVLRRILERAGV